MWLNRGRLRVVVRSEAPCQRGCGPAFAESAAQTPAPQAVRDGPSPPARAAWIETPACNVSGEPHGVAARSGGVD